jgi:hypothetical protein
MIVVRAGVDLTQVHPQFLADVRSILDPSPVLWLITRATATLAEQERLWRAWLAYRAYLRGEGPPAPFAGKAVPPGESAHNYGQAVDVVPDGDPTRPGVQPDWTPTLGDPWHDLAAAIDSHPRLRHGRRFGDWPHIEAVRWKQFKGWTTTPPLAA